MVAIWLAVAYFQNFKPISFKRPHQVIINQSINYYSINLTIQPLFLGTRIDHLVPEPHKAWIYLLLVVQFTYCS